MIVSPCISICKTDPVTGYCYGCARSEDEKFNYIADPHTATGLKVLLDKKDDIILINRLIVFQINIPFFVI